MAESVGKEIVRDLTRDLPMRSPISQMGNAVYPPASPARHVLDKLEMTKGMTALQFSGSKPGMGNAQRPTSNVQRSMREGNKGRRGRLLIVDGLGEGRRSRGRRETPNAQLGEEERRPAAKMAALQWGEAIEIGTPRRCVPTCWDGGQDDRPTMGRGDRDGDASEMRPYLLGR